MPKQRSTVPGMPADLTPIEASAWVAREDAQCVAPEDRLRRALLERETMARWKLYRFDVMMPIATQAQRDLIARLEA